MGAMRSVLLKASESRWLAEHLPRYSFARRAVRRFMPGETVTDALEECRVLGAAGVATVITQLGENITQAAQAAEVTNHYVEVLAEIRKRAVPTQVSVKLTQLGLDIDSTLPITSVQTLMRHSGADPIWIDMESSRYTDATLDVFRAARAQGENVGVCVQSYLNRTTTDLRKLLELTTAIRLVKGAYNEPVAVAYPRKSDVDASYLRCARMMLERTRSGIVGFVPAFATHDNAIIKKIIAMADEMGIAHDRYEFQMLYGINTTEQWRLLREGLQIRVLISYGSAWFAWYMRRLAERPANVLFVMRSIFGS